MTFYQFVLRERPIPVVIQRFSSVAPSLEAQVDMMESVISCAVYFEFTHYHTIHGVFFLHKRRA